MRAGHIAYSLFAPAKSGLNGPCHVPFEKVFPMDNWYVSLVPAGMAIAIIGYSFFVAYA